MQNSITLYILVISASLYHHFSNVHIVTDQILILQISTRRPDFDGSSIRFSLKYKDIECIVFRNSAFCIQSRKWERKSRWDSPQHYRREIQTERVYRILQIRVFRSWKKRNHRWQYPFRNVELSYMENDRAWRFTKQHVFEDLMFNRSTHDCPRSETSWYTSTHLILLEEDRTCHFSHLNSRRSSTSRKNSWISLQRTWSINLGQEKDQNHHHFEIYCTVVYLNVNHQQIKSSFWRFIFPLVPADSRKLRHRDSWVS